MKGASQSFCSILFKYFQMDLLKAGKIETTKVLRGIFGINTRRKY